MLSKHNRKSRTRITAGVTGAAALTLAGLALTASGTQAAVNLRADLGEAIGVDLQDVPAAPSPPEAPEAGAAPAPAPAPAAKEAPTVRIVTRDKDGKVTVTENGRPVSTTRHQRLVVKDGKVIEDYDMTVVSSANCGAPRGGDVTMESRDGKRHKIVICGDRIQARSEDAIARAQASREAAQARAEASREAAQARAEASRDAAIARGMAARDAAVARAEASREAAEASREAAQASRTIAIASADLGKRHALLGLKIARKSIEAQTDLSPSQKAAALRGVDEAIREVQAANKD